MSSTFTSNDVKNVSILASIPLETHELEPLAQGFTKTIAVVDGLESVALVQEVEKHHHITGLENVMRDDEVDDARQFTQAQALQNAKRKYQGFFVVDQVIEQE